MSCAISGARCALRRLQRACVKKQTRRAANSWTRVVLIASSWFSDVVDHACARPAREPEAASVPMEMSGTCSRLGDKAPDHGW